MAAPDLRLRDLMAAALLGLLLYLAAFAFIIDRPLTTGVIGMYLQYKENYLAGVQGQRKIVIFAGSNGRYSHRCETIAERTGITCANISSASGYDLQWQMSHYWRYLGKGDVLYMPLEYWPLLVEGVKVGSEAPYVVRHEHSALGMYPLARLPFALFYFDLRSFLSGIGEMMLQRAGVQRRRISDLGMTVQGDVLGADAAKALPYRSLQEMAAPSIDAGAYQDAASIAAVGSIIDTARAKGLVVVGGLPTVFADAVIPDRVVSRLRDLFEQHGACFVMLANRSQYPRAAFFDSPYHLQESAQIAHSNALAPLLAEIYRRGTC